MTVLLGFTLAAYNLDRIRSFRANIGWTTRGNQRSGRNGPSGAPVLGRTS